MIAKGFESGKDVTQGCLAAILLMVGMPVLIAILISLPGWLHPDPPLDCATIHDKYGLGSWIRDTYELQVDDPVWHLNMQTRMEAIIDNPQCYSSRTVRWAENSVHRGTTRSRR